MFSIRIFQIQKKKRLSDFFDDYGWPLVSKMGQAICHNTGRTTARTASAEHVARVVNIEDRAEHYAQAMKQESTQLMLFDELVRFITHFITLFTVNMFHTRSLKIATLSYRVAKGKHAPIRPVGCSRYLFNFPLFNFSMLTYIKPRDIVSAPIKEAQR